jgi:hypothetical protein
MWSANALREEECEKHDCASDWFFSPDSVHLNHTFFHSTKARFDNAVVKKHTHLKKDVPTLLDLARLCLIRLFPPPPNWPELGEANIQKLQRQGEQCQRESIMIHNVPTITPAGFKLRVWSLFNDKNRHLVDSEFLWSISELISATVSLMRILEPRFLYVQLAALGTSAYENVVSAKQLCHWIKACDSNTTYAETVKTIDRLLRFIAQRHYSGNEYTDIILRRLEIPDSADEIIDTIRKAFEFTVVSNRQLMARVGNVLDGQYGEAPTAVEMRNIFTQAFDFHRGQNVHAIVKCEELGWYLDTYVHGLSALVRVFMTETTNGWALYFTLVHRDTDSEDERITDGEDSDEPSGEESDVTTQTESDDEDRSSTSAPSPLEQS